MKGLLHLYIGDGKGKTTAAVGLAVRAAGNGLRVGFVQLLKGADTGEQRALRHIPGVCVLDNPETVPFATTAADRAMLAAQCEKRLAWASEHMAVFDLLVLDEALTAVSLELVPEQTLEALTRGRPQQLELVLTGRTAPQALLDAADYITRMEALRHPYDAGTPARRGVEY
ncbi:MAG: cob(I)yrinic acid a,c-diamide adenosyltransferase [Oscillospiraceae bacterium]|nr:cob(I)yrinic acid a,c-diamide adenosyltransferase [Oscillospiraceae bacterium]